MRARFCIAVSMAGLLPIAGRAPARTEVLLSGGPIRSSLPSDVSIRRMLAMRVEVQKRATGIVVGLTSPSGHRTIAYGVRSLRDRRPVNGHTVYDIGSLTKIFTALILAQDVERGRLRLDEPVRDCVPQSSGFLAPTSGRAATLADLATHTSGLPLRPDNLVSKDPDDKYAGYTTEDLLAFLSTFKPERPRGAAYDYSNVGYGLLGLALSRCDGADFGTLVRDRITRPLGLADTALTPTPSMLKREVAGYDVDLHPVPHWHLGALAPRPASDQLPMTF